MADVLQKASQWLEGQRQKHRTVPVEYRRGASSVALDATIGRTIFRIEDGYGRIERIESRDYLVRAADLVLDGQVRLPARGDEVRETVEGQIFTYEVMSPGREPEWRWSDPYRETLRIHTKQTGVEELP